MTSETISLLIRKRGICKRKLTIFTTFLDSLPVDRISAVLTELRVHLEQFKDVLSEFESVQSELEIICNDDDLETHYMEREEFISKYNKKLAVANSILQTMSPLEEVRSVTDSQRVETAGSAASEPVQSLQVSTVKLPTIKLPTFSGNYNQWLEFRDTYESMIHTSTISSVQKFHYLRASLEGDAQKIIQSLEVSDLNYQTAWELLCQRYNNEALLVHNHINALYTLKSLSNERASDLRDLVDNVRKNVRALETLNQPTKHWGTLLIFMLTRKLDQVTASEWEKSKGSDATLDSFLTFLQSRASLLETIDIKRGTNSNNSKSNCKQMKRMSLLVSNPTCNYCKQGHLIYNCEAFLKLDIPTRNEKASALKLCLNCLCTGHFAKQCMKGSCAICKKKHSSLLHISDTAKQEVAPSVTLSSQFKGTGVLLATATITIYDVRGKAQKIRAILDCGSQSNFISQRQYTKLGLQSEKTNVSIVGINSVSSSLSCKCEVTIKSRCEDYSMTLTCLILPEPMQNVPHYRLDVESWNIPEGLQLADPNFSEPSEVDLLIGASHFWSILKPERLFISKSLPILQNTVFGWVISGPLSSTARASQCYFVSESLEAGVSKFWEMEECDYSPSMSEDDSMCEAIFEKTSRDQSGRFVVRIPLKHPTTLLGNSKDMATKRFLQLERRFLQNKALKEQYATFINEYKNLNHMTSFTGDTSELVFLPHHGVLRHESLTTKLRVVFDGSADTSSGWSVNDLQYVGPTMQNDLFSILLQFRFHSVAVCADIEKMYRQILVHPEDRTLQAILWRENSSDSLSPFILNTVTYGMKSSPYLAIRCLKQLAQENETKYPASSRVLSENFYVDDLIASFQNEQEAVEVCQQLRAILRSAGFPLRKWASNSSVFLNEFKDDNDPISVICFNNDSQIKTLGVLWNNVSDKFSFCVNNSETNNQFTKRGVLSDMAKIFDPLGLVSPCILYAKIFLQKLWSAKMDWDTELPESLMQMWIRFKGDLGSLNGVHVERQVICANSISVEIHGFCDASMDAYGACIYVRSVDSNGSIQTRLLCSKTRVAPLKALTIPRLELSSAVLLARLLLKVKKHFSVDCNTYLWSDSQIVLAWIHSEPKLMQTFVQNRVAEIQNTTDIKFWSYVSSKDNPADVASRGCLPSNLVKCNLWWYGPSWLGQPSSSWPILPLAIPVAELPEMKKSAIISLLESKQEPLFHFTRFSNLRSLQRVAGYCMRFINNVRVHKSERTFGALNVTELEHGLKALVKTSQLDSFGSEIKTLRRHEPLKNSLQKLTPFLDDQDILRVGGRLKQSNLTYDAKHQMLIHSKHPLTNLIFKAEHLRLMHAGPQLLLATIHQNYWPIAGISLAKQTVRNCIVCFKYKPKPLSNIMGDLPKQRVNPSYAFQISGVDFAGPFLLKDRKGRGAKLFKGYICLFICFATKAVHLELVSTLSTDGFVAALRRFASRRGFPSEIWSDNGTNFVCASKILKELRDFFVSSKADILNSCAAHNVSWKFIPAHAPHMGGLWEAGVKGVKNHLMKVVGQTHLTFEEFYTLLVQVEGILNSRPLYPLTNDPNDLLPLTPSHFLIGRAITTTPDEPRVLEIPINRTTRYQLIQQLSQNFWKRWSNEYLHTLQRRSKWCHPTKNVDCGTLVLMKVDNLPPCNWKLGRVVEVHPGKDGAVRVVSIRTAKGIVKRPIVKVCPLPIEDPATSEV